LAGDDRKKQALALWERGFRAQAEGRLDDAMNLYRASLEACETAEAHTFIGWVYSWVGRIDDAIEACHKAIAADPSFGNPYNDIGVYLMMQGKPDDAIPWLERAKGAPRYEPRHFPYLNLGRLYLRKGRLSEALREFEGALRVQPDDEEAKRHVREIRARMN
jgi:Tfp pilus assembly protein PilF